MVQRRPGRLRLDSRVALPAALVDPGDGLLNELGSGMAQNLLGLGIAPGGADDGLWINARFDGSKELQGGGVLRVVPCPLRIG